MGAKNGGAKGSRTPGLLNAIQTLYQLSYSPKNTLQDVADEMHPITPAPENQEEFSEKFVVECEQLV